MERKVRIENVTEKDYTHVRERERERYSEGCQIVK